MPDEVKAGLPHDCAVSTAESLAKFATQENFSLSEHASDTIRDALIDTMGCILIGAEQTVSVKARTAFEGYGPNVSRVYGTDLMVAPETAALLNGTAAHSLDYDDYELPGNTHPSAVLFPAILAAGAGSVLSANDLIASYIAGFEAITRIGEAVNFDHYARGWHSTATIGAIGAAVAAARTMGLDLEKTTHAIAISASKAVGYTCQFGSDTKPLQAGFAAEAGVGASRLAKHGLTGQPSVLDAKNGFGALMSHGDGSRFDAAMAKIGNPLALEEHGLAVKLYPSCSYTHRLTDCAVELHARGLGDVDRIKRITLTLPDFHFGILPFRQPADRGEAMFSLPYNIALALHRGDITVTDLDAELWHDPTIQRLISLIEVQAPPPRNPALNFDPDQPDEMVVETHDGKVHRAITAFPCGSHENPASRERILLKFKRNAKIDMESDSDKRRHALSRLHAWPDVPDVLAVLDDLGGPK